MKKYNNVNGIDFEFRYRRAEQEYEELLRDFKIVTGWNTDMADRYNFLSEMLPTPSEIERLLHEYRTRFISMYQIIKIQEEFMEQGRKKAYQNTIDGIQERIKHLENLKHAVIMLNDNPVETAKLAVRAEHQHIFNPNKKIRWWRKLLNLKN